MKNNLKIGKFGTFYLATAAVLALNLLTAAAMENRGADDAYARYLAQAPEITPIMEEAATPEVTILLEEPAPLPCTDLRSNVEISKAPLTTVSDTCITATVTPGTIALEYIPDSFSFPLKYVSNYRQDSFSNDDPATLNIDVSTGTDDILTLHDFRNEGGFSVTITAGRFESSTGSIPLNNLYVATTYPENEDFALLDPALIGAENNGVKYAADSKGAQDIVSGAVAKGDLNLPDSYAVSFDGNNDGISDVIELMGTSTGHVGRFSQALSFLLKIPANQPPGAYQAKFTMDLIY
jgi:hypothetical protein